MSKLVDLDDDDTIRESLRDHGELVKDGMRRVVLDELIAAPDDAWWNPLQGALPLGPSWLATGGVAVVAINGPGAGTVWLRDSFCDEDLLWPLGLQHSGIDIHGTLVDSHDHSLLDYITLRVKGRLPPSSEKKESSHAGGAYTQAPTQAHACNILHFVCACGAAIATSFGNADDGSVVGLDKGSEERGVTNRAAVGHAGGGGRDNDGGIDRAATRAGTSVSADASAGSRAGSRAGAGAGAGDNSGGHR